MNIFIMMLVALFMGTYYLISSPSLRIREQEIDYAITRADLRSIAECTMAAHNATINGHTFDDECVEKNGIKSNIICMDSRNSITTCDGVKNKRPEYTYILTTTQPIQDEAYNDMMEILEQHYANVGTFGVLIDNQIVSGSGTKRNMPKPVTKEYNVSDGQLVYLTQYSIPDVETEYETTEADDMRCPAGTVKVFRFGRWQCIKENTKTNCAGDMIWDSDLAECIPDESRKPLCAAQQTAVIVDDVWECLNPFADKTCGGGMIARLNYNTLEWECVSDPNATQTARKCDYIASGVVYGRQGATLRLPPSSCTDCETLYVDQETCRATCLPDPSKLGDPRCYPENTRTCSGSTMGFYFGFPDAAYIAKVSAVKGTQVPLDSDHSKNRKFNCMDCGIGGINESKSLPPYVIVCN
ncbi:MAG: hypothetical protein J6W40_05365 [Alphaproteobacteria bacterium]|nr:hypothetical protein [Alphaproteobacteria bacterium]